MTHRMLLKAVLVAAMGAVALGTPEEGKAAQGPCYTCLQGGYCPDEATHRTICESLGVSNCTEPSLCYESSACSGYQMTVTCGA
jgi:hypothetical protein